MSFILIIIIIIIRGLFSDIIVVLAQAGANTGNNSLFTKLLQNWFVWLSFICSIVSASGEWQSSEVGCVLQN